MEYTLVRSGRKTLCIQLRADGSVVVRAPRRCPKWYIDEFVAQKQDWISSRRAAIQARNDRRDSYDLAEGETVSICGDPFTVHLAPGLRARLLGRRLILSNGDLSRQREAIIALAKEYSRPRLTARLDDWAAKMGVSYRELRFSTARTRWGSCAYDGTIRLSVWLLFAPMDLIDYVLVHELAHRRHFDHSPAFWAEVSAMLPDYPARKRQLRAFQETPLLLRLAEKGEGQ